ncbi:hypothetical protein [Gracilibacillus salitolerans]|uniref:hypothetical protein n=1 Tax=Gracilibacillus salitolerans TaxID=2663022 RepID=UPI001890EB7A|nr:hypothetical protein [Gracilibacillus salitolerans]
MRYKIGVSILIISLFFNIFLLFQNKELERMADGHANTVYANWYGIVIALSDPAFYSSLSENEESNEIGRFFGASEDLVGILLSKYPELDRDKIGYYTNSSIFTGEITNLEDLRKLIEKHDFTKNNFPSQEQFEKLFEDVNREYDGY